MRRSRLSTRRFPLVLRAALAIGGLTAGLVALPAIGLPSGPAPRPVATVVTTVPLAGIDPSMRPLLASRAGGAIPVAEPQPEPDDGTPTTGRPVPAGPAVPVVLTDQRSTRAFSALGVTWSAAATTGAVEVQVRTHTRGAWTDWKAVGGDGGDTPDPGTPDLAGDLRAGSRMLYVGPSDGVQVRVDARGRAPADLRVELIDAGRSAADRRVATRARVLGGVARADEGMPRIVSRAEWGADDAGYRCRTSYSPTVKVGFVHHTDTGNDYSPAEAPGVVRAIYAYHAKSRGWCDVGYNFLVDRYGTIYEGRAGGVDRAVIGAHTGGFNYNSFAASLMGNFSTAVPPAAMLDSLERLFAWKLAGYYLDPAGTGTLTSSGGGTSRYSSGTAVRFPVVSGHRDAGNTSCPGDQTYARMGEIRSGISRYLGVALTSPVVGVAEDGAVTASAGVRGDAAWTATISTPSGATVASFSGGPGTPVAARWSPVDAAGRRPGGSSYVVRLDARAAADSARPYTATVTAGPVAVGSLDEVAVGLGGGAPGGGPAPGPGGVTVRGWAAQPGSSDPVAVRAVVDDGSGIPSVADQPRPDVAAAHPDYGPSRGYSFAVPVPDGVHRVCVYAVDGAGGGDRRLGCQSVTVRTAVVGGLDEVSRAGAGAVTVRGWLLDPLTREPIRGFATVDGSWGRAFDAADARPDIGAAFGAGDTHGYRAAIPASIGTHTVCVFGVRSGTTAASPAGCRVVPGPTAPLGGLDTARVTPSGVEVTGWALDPDTTAPISVHLYVDGRWAGQLVAGGDRPDVAAAYPGAGTRHGWQAVVTPAPGPHQVCAYAINVGRGAGNPLLGCRGIVR